MAKDADKSAEDTAHKKLDDVIKKVKQPGADFAALARALRRARDADAVGIVGAVQKATDAAEMLPTSAKNAMTKAMSFAENNVNAAFDLAQKLVRAKDVNEVLALQSEFAKSQMAAMQTQAKELGAVAQDVITPATRK